MERYQTTFATLRQRNEGALVPFFMLEDPNYQTCYQLIETAIEAGADALELGIAFSDPVADGPVIQRAHLRAQTAGASFATSLKLVRQVRDRHPAIPIGLLVYANVAYALGVDNFYRHLAQAGVDSVLLPDVPLREAEPFLQSARAHRVSQVFIAPPGADAGHLKRISAASTGYIYLVSRPGVTGTETKAAMDHIRRSTAYLHQQAAPPALVGFGISTPADVRAVIEAGAEGAICGSAIVKLIEAAGCGPDREGDTAVLKAQVHQFVAGLKAATLGAQSRGEVS